jgi:hypothetical protein
VTDSGALAMDLYYPPRSEAQDQIPAVIFVTGFSDLGAETMLGSKFKDMGAFVSWAQLAAASGFVGITYANREPDDIYGVPDCVQQHAASLRIDRSKIARCAVLAYAYTLDLDGSTGVADAAKQFRFVTPAAGKSVKDLPHDLPLFIVRAGRDQMPGLNDALDRFVTAALALNLPVTVMNHALGPHAFDLFDDSRIACDIVKQMLAFLQLHLFA